MQPRITPLLALTLTLSCAGTRAETEREPRTRQRSSTAVTLERAEVPAKLEADRQRCLAGQGHACVSLARGLEPDVDCPYGHHIACAGYPLAALEEGEEEDPGPTTTELAWERALQNLERECSAGAEASSCLLLARIERKGEAGDADRASAARHIDAWARLEAERCRGGDPQLCYTFARELEREPDAPNDRARIYYGLACARWHIRACDAALRPYARSREWPGTRAAAMCKPNDSICNITARAELMDSNSLEAFGALGESAPSPMLVKARKRLRRGCTRGRTEDCHALGNLEELGRGGSRDLDQAATHYKAACDAKRAGACQALGYQLLRADLKARDTSRARAAFKRGCELDPSHGCGELAVLLEHGVGIDAAPEEARGLYQRVCDAGELEYACERVSALSG